MGDGQIKNVANVVLVAGTSERKSERGWANVGTVQGVIIVSRRVNIEEGRGEGKADKSCKDGEGLKANGHLSLSLSNYEDYY
jgi:hypothetical protein